MIYIYKADSATVRKNTSLVKLLEGLPEIMHKKALRYKFEQDAFNFVTGRMLLKEGLKQFKELDQFEQIEYLESGKPFLKDLFFNISHSDTIVVCAISSHGEIGIDIEKVKQIELENFKSFFTVNEWTEINAASSPLQKFYWYWTRKESIIKAMGVSLSYLHQIEIDPAKDYFIDNGKKWYLTNLDLGDGIYGALCSGFPAKDIRIVK